MMVLLAVLFIVSLASPFALVAATKSPKMPIVPKWGRFELSFKSAALYSNALQEASLSAVFTSPLGETQQVDGFWDGGKTWRIRFSPDQPGRWTFQTTCSDASNRGLHDQSGQFLCTSSIGTDRFREHGPVRVARDHRHLEHADGTPFIWLADTIWNGARLAAPANWDFYSQARASQNFSAAQWAVAPGEDAKGETAIAGFPERIAVNPAFFQRLDAKLETLSRAGILSGIVPLLELDSQRGAGPELSDEQTLLLVRYVVARWGAEPVVWLLAFDNDSQGKKASRWKSIGQAVFAQRAHAPVLLYPGESSQLLDEFRDQSWVDIFGFKTVSDLTDQALKWTFAGPFAKEWSKLPERPLLPFLPFENTVRPQPGKRFNADDVRRAAYWSLLLAPTAGLSYGARGVADWDTSIETGTNQLQTADLPMWQKSMFMPGAKQMAQLAKFLGSLDFGRLRPQPKLLASQPGDASPLRWTAAASTEAGDLSLVYVPEDRSIELILDSLPASPVVTWFNPRTGQNNPAVAVVSARTCQFPTPDPGDWLLVLKAGKQ